MLPPWQTWELAWKDSTIRANTRPVRHTLLAAIDEYSFELIQRRWPWPRTVLAEGIRRIAEGKPRMLVLDIGLWDPGFTPEEDQALVEALRGVPHVLPIKFGVQFLEGMEVQKLYRPHRVFRQEGTRLGYVNLAPDPDGVIRDLTGPETFNEELWPSLAQAALGGIPSPIPAGGSKTPLWRGPPGAVPRVSFGAIAVGDVDPQAFTDRIVVVGAAFPESKDYFPTAFRDWGDTYGLEIHAQAVEALAADEFLNEASIWMVLPVHLTYALALGLALFIAPYLWFLPLVGVGALLGLGGLYGAVWAGTLWPATPVLVIWFVLFQAALWDRFLREMRERQKVTRHFSRYVSPKVIRLLLDSSEEVPLGGVEREVTILFTDIRNFTALSEKWTPDRVVSMLNQHFREMCAAVWEYDGTVNKFIGDALMAIFNAPLDQNDAPERAVKTALSMRRRLAAMNELRVQRGESPVQIGIGIHCGKVISGNIGTPEQMDYTVIGDAVNVASRVESLCKHFATDLLITDEIYAYIKDRVEVISHEPVNVKGRRTPVLVHTVLRWRGEP